MSIPKFLKWALALMPLCSANAWGQTQLKAEIKDATITVTPITDNIVRVTNIRDGQNIRQSKATVLDGALAKAQVSTDGDMQSLFLDGGISATLDAKTGEVVINGGSATKIIADNGVRTLSDGMQTLTLYTTSQGSYYGAGERGHSINLRGDTLVMYNRQNYGYGKGDPRISQMNITMPLFISSDGFAVLFDDYAAASMALGQNSTITYRTENPDAVSYYYINGTSNIADVVENLSALTGRQPLPPLWALGYITSKYGYRDEAETIGAIDTLKTQGYPVDGIVLDLYWYGKEEDMGRLAWDPQQWPDPQGMLAALKDQGVNLVAISQPYVLRNGRGAANYEYLSKNGMLLADSTGTSPQEVKIWVGEGGMLDVSNPATRQWLADTYKDLTDMGITGWWGDLGEPEVHPESGLHANGLATRQYHNQYGNDWSQIIYDMFKQEFPDARLLTMMRGGTTGLQRYSVFPWSTDVARSWEGLQPQITIMLNSGLSGLGYMGHDVGGFAVDPENPYNPELYVRWLQLGLFSPMLRTHAQSQAEPYHYPQYSSIILPIIKERYRWLPYNYTLAYENAAFGYPMVRPLNFYEAGSNAYDAIDDEYLWGSEVLVAPVMAKGATERVVTFPEGTWVDYADPQKKYYGGSTITYPAPLDVLPLFVRAGAFIPMSDAEMESTAQYNPANLTVEYYPVKGVSSEYTLYDDNRISASSLEKGEYRLVTFTGKWEGDEIAIHIDSKGTYAGAPSILTYELVLNGIPPACNGVSIDKGNMKVTEKDGNLAIIVKFIPGQQSPTIKVNP